MGIDEQFRIDRIQGPDKAPGNDGVKPVQTGETDFRRLLEKLESVARQPTESQQVEDLDALREAMQKADDDYAAVMELRQSIEAAYRKVQP